MNNPSPAAIRAAELANAEARQIGALADWWNPDEFGDDGAPERIAFRKFIERVSEVAKFADEVLEANRIVEKAPVRTAIRALILPKPVDPLVELLDSFGVDREPFEESLAQRGFKITKIGEWA